MKSGNEARTLLSSLGILSFMGKSGSIVVYEPGETCSASISVRDPKAYVLVIVPDAAGSPVVAKSNTRQARTDKRVAIQQQNVSQTIKSKRNAPWTRQQVVIAVDAYVRGNTSQKEIKALSDKIGRGVNAITWKFSNLRSCDSTTDAKGAVGGSKVDKAVYDTYMKNLRGFRKELKTAKALFGI